MGKKNSFRVKVMKYAWQIFRVTGQAIGICLKKAWQLYRLSLKLRQGIAAFVYRKADGSERQAVGTLRGIPSGASFGGKKVTKPSYKTVTYFDLDKNAFRCFKSENLVCIL